MPGLRLTSCELKGYSDHAFIAKSPKYGGEHDLLVQDETFNCGSRNHVRGDSSDKHLAAQYGKLMSRGTLPDSNGRSDEAIKALFVW